jgi:hypothetical protein
LVFAIIGANMDLWFSPEKNWSVFLFNNGGVILHNTLGGSDVTHNSQTIVNGKGL